MTTPSICVSHIKKRAAKWNGFPNQHISLLQVGLRRRNIASLTNVSPAIVESLQQRETLQINPSQVSHMWLQLIPLRPSGKKPPHLCSGRSADNLACLAHLSLRPSNKRKVFGPVSRHSSLKNSTSCYHPKGFLIIYFLLLFLFF